jgi:hypothetical protein
MKIFFLKPANRFFMSRKACRNPNDAPVAENKTAAEGGFDAVDGRNSDFL